MAVKAWIDENGIHVPSYPEVLADLQGEFRAIYGPDLYLEADSQEGALVAAFALRIHDCYTLAASVYNSYAPSTAQGVGLSSVVKVNGINRHVAGHSSVAARVIGRPGTVIDGGVVTDTAGRRWLLPSRVTIPGTGEAAVTAVAEDPGDIRAAAGEIVTIATPTFGWQAVINTAAAVPGAPVESDAALRRRQATSTALPSRTVFEGTLGAVASVPGVTRWRGYENDTSEPDDNGLPPHSITVVVEGGDDAAIAQSIAAKKSPGCYTHGDVLYETRDKHGSPNVIRFFRPTSTPVAVNVEIRPFGGYVAATGEAIRNNIADYINSMNIGDDVLLSKLYSPINAAEPNPGQRSFDVLSLSIGVKGGATMPVTLPISYKGVAVCSLDDVTLRDY